MRVEQIKWFIGALGVILAPAAFTSATKTKISAANLVGLWKHGAGSELAWVNSSGGYVGSQSVAYSESWDLRGDMTYDSQFGGVSSIVGHAHQQKTGTWSLSKSKITLSPGDGTREEGYWIISFKNKPNGSVLTLLPDRFELDEGNYIYKQVWTRAKS